MKLIGQGPYDGVNDSEIIPPENLKVHEDNIAVQDVPTLEKASIIDIFIGKQSIEDIHDIGETFYMTKIMDKEVFFSFVFVLFLRFSTCREAKSKTLLRHTKFHKVEFCMSVFHRNLISQI